MRKPFLSLLAVLALGLAACAAPVTAPPGDRPGPAELTSRYVITADGLALPIRSWLPDTPPGTPPKAVVLALHGFNDYSGAFREAGPALAEAEIAVYAYDQRGFGEAPNRGLWPGSTALKGDAAAVARLLQAKYPETPVYLLGLSMGGAVAMTTLADWPDAAAGAVLVAPAVRGRQTMPDWQAWGLDMLARTIPGYAATGQGLRIRPTDNIEVLRRMARDPNVLKTARIDALYGLVELMTEAQDSAPRQRKPLLFLYGLKDELVPKEPTQATLAALPQDAGHRIAVYPEGRHMLLRDLAGGRVIADIAAWLTDPTAPLPSGADDDARDHLSAARE